MTIADSQQIESWVQGACRGDQKAFEMLVRQFQDAVAGVILARLGPRSDVEDIAQDAFVAAYMQLAEFRDPARFGPWVCGIARNLALRYLRDRKPTVSLPDQLTRPPQEAAPDLADQVMSAVAQLPERLREPLTLYYIDGYTTGEVAELLELPDGTVRRRLHEARNLLRGQVETTVKDEIKRQAPSPEFPGRVVPRLSDGARKAMALANQQAQRLGHDYVDPVHILIGILGERDGPGARALKRLGVGVRKARAAVRQATTCSPGLLKKGKAVEPRRGKAVVEYAVRAARYADRGAVGTEHLLLGVLAHGGELLAEVLESQGTDADRVRRELDELSVTESRRYVAKPRGQAGLGKDGHVTSLEPEREADLDFFRSLFAREVPQVANGTVEVKAVGREAGVLAKVAVWSCHPDIDPVAVCLGKDAARMKKIQENLAPEKIDIIRWHPASKLFVLNAVRPAQACEATLCPELGLATVVVPEDQIGDALGKEGARIRAAARLVGWDLDVVTPAELGTQLLALEAALYAVEGVGRSTIDRIIAAGLVSVSTVVEMGPQRLAELLGLDPQTADGIVASCRAAARRKPEGAEAYG